MNILFKSVEVGGFTLAVDYIPSAVRATAHHCCYIKDVCFAYKMSPKLTGSKDVQNPFTAPFLVRRGALDADRLCRSQRRLVVRACESGLLEQCEDRVQDSIPAVRAWCTSSASPPDWALGCRYSCKPGCQGARRSKACRVIRASGFCCSPLSVSCCHAPCEFPGTLSYCIVA
jgi:hypothetical protein